MAVVRILAILLAALALNCAAAPFTVRLGIERIVIDAPPGLADTTELASPRLQDLAATLTSDAYRVLLFALTDADLRRFTLGDQIEARRYAIALTPKALERERVGKEILTALEADSQRDLGKPAEFKDLIEFLESQPIGKAHLLAEPESTVTTATVLQAMRLPPVPGYNFWERSKPQYQISTTTLMLLRGKALRIGVYALYDGPADLQWLKATTLRWLEDLQRLNR